MSRRRLDRLEGSLDPKVAVLRWMGEAHAFPSLAAYVASLLGQPESAQPFVALPAQVEMAVWESMRGKRPGFVKEVTREAVGDTVFLLRLVIGLNVHIQDALGTEQLRQAALHWWSRALDSDGGRDGRSDWQRGVAIHRRILLGTDRARASAERRYLDGHDCLFPELAAEWRDLCAAAESLAGSDVVAVDETTQGAERSVQRVILMARADGLEAAGQNLAADAMAERVGRHLGTTEATDG